MASPSCLRLLNLDKAPIPREYFVLLEIEKRLDWAQQERALPLQQQGTFPFCIQLKGHPRAVVWSNTLMNWVALIGPRQVTSRMIEHNYQEHMVTLCEEVPELGLTQASRLWRVRNAGTRHGSRAKVKPPPDLDATNT